jgi:hypothetical protein
MGQEQNAKAKRGFAAMPPKRQHEIASLGGRTAHKLKVAHEWTPEEAKAAGKKGGAIAGQRRINRAENDGSDHLL